MKEFRSVGFLFVNKSRFRVIFTNQFYHLVDATRRQRAKVELVTIFGKWMKKEVQNGNAYFQLILDGSVVVWDEKYRSIIELMQKCQYFILL